MRIPTRCAIVGLIGVVTANAAVAAPNAIDACKYFERQLQMIPTAKAALIIPPIEQGDFELLSTSLERYEHYVRRNITAEVAIARDDGQILPTGRFSASISCVVDKIDRRVLSVSISEGPTVGQEIALSNGQKRKVMGVTEQFIEIGAQAHQGKY